MAVFVVVVCVFGLFATVGAHSPHDLCDSSGHCGRCVDDIHHMSGVFDTRVTHVGTSMQSLQGAISVRIERLKTIIGSSGSVLVHLNDRRMRTITELEYYQRALSAQIDKLRVAINRKPKDYNLLTIVSNIRSTEKDIQVALKKVLSIVSKIRMLVKTPPAIFVQINKVNFQILDLNTKLVSIQNSIVALARLDRSITVLDSLRVSVNSISVALVDIQKSLKQFDSIRNDFSLTVDMVRVNQQTLVKRVTALVNSIDLQFVEINKKVQIHNGLLVSISNIIKTLQVNVNSISVIIASFKTMSNQLKVSVLGVDNEVTVLHKSLKSIETTMNRIIMVVNNLKSKSASVYSSYVSIETHAKKIIELTEVYIRKEKTSLLQIIGILDDLIKLQSSNDLSIKSAITTVKQSYQGLSAKITANGVTLSRTSQRATAVGGTMSEAIEILKKLTNSCRCKSKQVQKCPNRCSDVVSSVCASNGVTYTNECYMNLAACNADAFYSAVHSGVCVYKAPVVTTVPTVSPCTKVCPLTLQPVCGSDHNTYPGQCDVDKHNCLTGSNVRVVHQGACIKPTAEPTCNTACPRILQQICGSDGHTYDNFCLLNRYNCIHKTTIYVVSFSACKVKTTQRPNVCDFKCTKIFKPVCGSDGITYSSRCLLDERACYTGISGLYSHDGPCVAPKPEATVVPCGFCVAVFKPVCGSDGVTYSNDCELKRKACLTNAVVYKMTDGPCLPGGGSVNINGGGVNVNGGGSVHVNGGGVSINSGGISFECSTVAVCAKTFTPVCGSDGITYDNDCLRKQKHCQNQLVSTSLPGYCSAVCTGGFVKISGISGCLYVVAPTRTADQEEARADCISRGARLISFASDAEYEAVKAYVARRTVLRRKRNYWTSGREIDGLKTWVWYPEGYIMALTRSWHPKRPRRSRACAAMYGTVRFALVDVKCRKADLYDKYGWICRK